MTWGVQNSEADGHAQLDYAIKERGINFVDTAELYPVPLSSPDWRAGRTEEIIGTWLHANPEWRAKLVLATKVCGYAAKSRIADAVHAAQTETRLPAGQGVHFFRMRREFAKTKDGLHRPVPTTLAGPVRPRVREPGV